ncbi:MAG TPA: HD domain-containing phosphohydrolase [Abditibacteriaceae bacterium]|nr:HD domain-containing phosphohydrolase [Abditibacteriaceae bacterium]
MNGDSPSASEAFIPGIPTDAAFGALDGLDAARAAVVTYQSEMEARVNGAQAEVLKAQQAVESALAEMAALSRDRDHWRTECQRDQQILAQLQRQLAEQREQSHSLRDELLELYQDLRAEDLPTLILRIGMNLTGAENALYTGPQGETTIAAIGLENLPEVVSQALYKFTRAAAQRGAPLECNDARQLPEGAALVNLAAVPVALKGQVSGVMLIANKRSGPFSDEDTELLLSIGRHAGIAMENQRLHCALGDAYVSTIAVLADAIEAKDPYTRGHCESVAVTAVQVGERLGFNKDELQALRYAALLHDVGKIGIPDGILLKPGRLLPEEFQVIQRHAEIGSDLVKRISSLIPIAPAIRHHHERFDGAGYPDGLCGEGILMASRVVGVVDALDAMTTPRPYREPVSIPEALEELRRCSGSQFDPAVVDAIAEVLAERGAV